MKKRLYIRWKAITLSFIMLFSLFTNFNVYANEVVDRFYILDEDGNPITVEITQSDLDNYIRPEQPFALMPMVESGDEDEEKTEEIIGIVRFNRGVTTINYKEAETGRTGYISPNTAGDAAYISTEEEGIVCYIGGCKIIVNPDDVAEIVSYKEQSLSSYYTANGYLIHRYSYFDGGETPKLSTLRVGLAPSYLEEGVHYYSYDGHYFYATFEAMIDDYRNDTRENSVNPTNPHYNYYQYLSFHTTACYSGDEYDAYVLQKKGADSGSAMLEAGSAFVSTQNSYIANSIIMFGIAINESGWGMSSIAQDKNNLFGLNAVDSNPYNEADEFDSVEQCIEEFAYYYIQCKYLKGTDSRYRGPHLGNKQSGFNVKYASDPYWGEKAASRPYYFDEDNRDYGRYTLGIAKNNMITLYNEPDEAAQAIYTTDDSSGKYIYDYPVTILETVECSDGKVYYKIISDMPLLNDRSARDVEAQYKPSRDYVYAKESDIQIVFEGNGKDIIIPDPEPICIGEHTYKKEAFYWSEDCSSCEAVFVCDVCGDDERVLCTIMQEGDVYIASCEFEGITYEEQKTISSLPFTDVPNDIWYRESVEYVYKHSIMTGKNDTHFEPESPLKRSEFCTILHRMEGKPDITYKNIFPDVPDGLWYTDGIIWAYENGIVTGHGDGYFRGEDFITREQMALMMYRYGLYKKYTMSLECDLSSYPDYQEVSSYAKEAMQWAVADEIITGKEDGKLLDPLGKATRAECATIIKRFCEKFNMFSN